MLKGKIKELLTERNRLLTLILFYKHDEKEEQQFLNLISKINISLSKTTYYPKTQTDIELENLIVRLTNNATKEIKEKLKNYLTKKMNIKG